jgi:hypothetical protein
VLDSLIDCKDVEDVALMLRAVFSPTIPENTEIPPRTLWIEMESERVEAVLETKTEELLPTNPLVTWIPPLVLDRDIDFDDVDEFEIIWTAALSPEIPPRNTTPPIPLDTEIESVRVDPVDSTAIDELDPPLARISTDALPATDRRDSTTTLP